MNKRVTNDREWPAGVQLVLRIVGMNHIKRILSFLKAGGVFLGTIVGVLASTDKSETSDLPQGDGSDLLVNTTSGPVEPIQVLTQTAGMKMTCSCVLFLYSL